MITSHLRTIVDTGHPRSAGRLAVALAIIMAGIVQSPALEAGLFSVATRAFSVESEAATASNARPGTSSREMAATEPSDDGRAPISHGERLGRDSYIGKPQLVTGDNAQLSTGMLFTAASAGGEPQTYENATSTRTPSSSGSSNRSSGMNGANRASASLGSGAVGSSDAADTDAPGPEQESPAQGSPDYAGSSELSNAPLFNLEDLAGALEADWSDLSKPLDSGDSETGIPISAFGTLDSSTGTSRNSSINNQAPTGSLLNNSFFETQESTLEQLLSPNFEQLLSPNFGETSSSSFPSEIASLVGKEEILAPSSPGITESLVAPDDGSTAAQIPSVPEPSTLGWLGIGALTVWRRLRKYDRRRLHVR